ncbi:class I SAM-dependent methyltransferase [Roseobacter sp. AzwK-3b]|uniref:class I SAM-dependent methyltransferase n=1 Tax=Roseobacter sp. AzwK-3b TaxID=351016 RepID=UPI0012F4C779|nr:class I SAM-dependent methyltransferase [Roseobacter sp. AzwK-3b]
MGKRLTSREVDGITCYSEDVASDYADYPDEGFDLTDDYAETSFWVQSRNRLFSWLVHRERDRLGQARLLDVGCGTGDFVQHLSNDGSLTITGSEIYLKGLQFAQKRQPTVEFIQYDVTMGALDRDYDIVTAFDVFEHIEQDVTGLRNVHEMLSDDGALILSVPQHMFLWSRLDEIVCHKRRYSRTEMIEKLRQSGFTPIRVTSHVFTLFPLMAISRLLDRAKSAKTADVGTDDQALSERVTFSDGVNWLFNKIMYLDEALIRLGLSLPFGGTLVVVARKTAP